MSQLTFEFVKADFNTNIVYRDVTELANNSSNGHIVIGQTTVEVVGERDAITLANHVMKAGNIVTRMVHNGRHRVHITYTKLVRE